MQRRPRTSALTAVVVLAALGAGWLGWEWHQLPDPTPLRTANPAITSLMEQRAREARAKGLPVRRRQIWVPLGAIARIAVEAVIISEDADFYQHAGVDYVELRKALGEALLKRHLGRGASTITQQLAKNLWLSTDRSLLRKLKELVLAKRLEAKLTKSRILTLYLNVVEWGDGVYGIEAASLEHFGVHASALTPAQAAMLASMLPAPRKRLPRLMPVALHRHALLVLQRLEAAGRLDPSAAADARGQLERFFGRPETPAEEEEEDESPEDSPQEQAPPPPARAPTPPQPVEPAGPQDDAGQPLAPVTSSASTARPPPATTGAPGPRPGGSDGGR